MKNYQKIIKMLPSGYGHWRITISYYGREISATTNDMPTLDLFKSEERGWKNAGNILYDEVVKKNK